jgi:hypothetical protein
MIKTRFFIVSIRQPNVAKTEKGEIARLASLQIDAPDSWINTTIRKELNYRLEFLAARQTGTPRHFVFDKEPIRARGYQQYEQSAGMDRNTLSLGRNMDR